jgi:single-stranded DNA-specific DHH superfamily exonuclease
MQLNQIQFQAGTEKLFANFISKLNEKDKIALITHTDLDGLIAAKIANEVLNANIIKFVRYEELNQILVKELKRGGFTKVIFTDLLIERPDFIHAIEKFADILIIDHHLFKQDFNNEEITFMNAQGYCAAYLSYYLFSKIQNIEKFDWLVAIACIADFYYIKNAEFMSEVMEKYGDNFILANNMIKEEGLFWRLQWDISLALIYYKDNLRKVYDALDPKMPGIDNLKQAVKFAQTEIDLELKKFEKEKKQIKDILFYVSDSKYGVKSFISTNVSLKYPHETIIILEKDEKYYQISARRQDGKVNTNDLLKSLLNGLEDASGGGHLKAAGGHFLLKDLDEFKRRLQNQ